MPIELVLLASRRLRWKKAGADISTRGFGRCGVADFGGVLVADEGVLIGQRSGPVKSITTILPARIVGKQQVKFTS